MNPEAVLYGQAPDAVQKIGKKKRLEAALYGQALTVWFENKVR